MKNSIFAFLAFVLFISNVNSQSVSPQNTTNKFENSINLKTSLGAMILGKYKFVGEYFLTDKKSMEFEIGVTRNLETLTDSESRDGYFTSFRYKHFYKGSKKAGLYVSPGLGIGRLRSYIDQNLETRTNVSAFVDTGFQFSILKLVGDMFIGLGYSSNGYSGEITGTHTTIVPHLAGRIGFRTGFSLE